MKENKVFQNFNLKYLLKAATTVTLIKKSSSILLVIIPVRSMCVTPRPNYPGNRKESFKFK